MRRNFTPGNSAYAHGAGEIDVLPSVEATADPVTGEQVAKRVTHLWVHHDDLTELVLDVDADGDGVPDRLVTTEDHPFWNATDGAWEGPEEFAAGDEVLTEQWDRVSVVGLDPGTTRRDLAYNLTVEGIHTYHVGASDVLVHNTGDGCGPSGDAPKVLRDGEGATPEQFAASKGGPTGGSRAGQAEGRQELLDEADGVYTCWRCGTQSTNAANMHAGHRNFPRSKGGNLSKENLCLEGAACNLSAGNRGVPSPGMSCAERGGCGAPYGRFD